MSDLMRGMICFSLAIGFEEDRARLGLPAAVDGLRDARAYNRLTLDSDDRLLAGYVSHVELAGGICSARRPKSVAKFGRTLCAFAQPATFPQPVVEARRRHVNALARPFFPPRLLSSDCPA
jgi:hypothetical protein